MSDKEPNRAVAGPDEAKPPRGNLETNEAGRDMRPALCVEVTEQFKVQWRTSPTEPSLHALLLISYDSHFRTRHTFDV